MVIRGRSRPKRHLIPKQIEEHGLTEEQFPIQDETLLKIADSYTREAGVRNLERELSSTIRSVAVKVATDTPLPETIAAENLDEILGPVQFYPETAERTEIPGVATGLAWTPTGGEILFIEATSMMGKGRLILSGHLGDVMKESAQAASARTAPRRASPWSRPWSPSSRAAACGTTSP